MQLTSEVENIMNGSVVRKEGAIDKAIGVSTINLEPDVNGMVPLSNQSAFQLETSTLIQPQAPKDTLEEVPISVASTEDLGSFNIPSPTAQIVNEEIPEAEKVDVPLNIAMPQMPDTILAEEPSSVNNDLFATTQIENPTQAPAEVAPAPAPAEVVAAPAEMAPTPTTDGVVPAPAEVAPTPTTDGVVPTPAEVAPTPAPADVVAAPAEMAPTPTTDGVVPAPAEVAPAPAEVVAAPAEMAPTPTTDGVVPAPTEVDSVTLEKENISDSNIRELNEYVDKLIEDFKKEIDEKIEIFKGQISEKINSVNYAKITSDFVEKAEDLMAEDTSTMSQEEPQLDVMPKIELPSVEEKSAEVEPVELPTLETLESPAVPASTTPEASVAEVPAVQGVTQAIAEPTPLPATVEATPEATTEDTLLKDAMDQIANISIPSIDSTPIQGGKFF